MTIPAGPQDVDPTGHQDKPYLSTMWAPTDPTWNALVHVHPAERLTWKDLRGFRTVLPGKRGLILRGSVSRDDRYRDLVLALYVKWTRLPSRRPAVLLTDATWEPRSRALEGSSSWRAIVVPTLVRTMIRLLDGSHVTYAVLSTDELHSFASTWGVDPDRVVFTPFCHTLHADHATPAVTDRGHVFAGGNSLRDYDFLRTALEGVPDAETVGAARWRPSTPLPHLQAVTVPHEDFVELMASCRVCVTPLTRSVRSAGQQTYLNAMALGKPVVVTDSPGVRDYVEDGVSGFVVSDEDPGEMAAALRFVLAPENHAAVQAVAQRGRDHVLTHHTEDEYRRSLVRAMVDAVEGSARHGGPDDGSDPGAWS